MECWITCQQKGASKLAIFWKVQTMTYKTRLRTVDRVGTASKTCAMSSKITTVALTSRQLREVIANDEDSSSILVVCDKRAIHVREIEEQYHPSRIDRGSKVLGPLLSTAFPTAGAG
mmetsp:Transcript_117559/g.339868  ORF Transcript_117559/g.339868 Transcript_117559/m.339868 type:complete len:117 (-) Transcript_117559:938-1288(-)